MLPSAVVSVLHRFWSILKYMNSEVSLYIVPLLSSQPDAITESASMNIGKFLEAAGTRELPHAIFTLSSSGVIDKISISEEIFSEGLKKDRAKFIVLFCEGNFEVSPPSKYFIEQFRFLFRTLSVVYPLSQLTIRSVEYRENGAWMIGESGVHPLYLIEHINALCSEIPLYSASLRVNGWYAASFQEVSIRSSEDGKVFIIGWVQNSGIRSWECGSALGAVRLGFLGRDEKGDSVELRFDFERSIIFPGDGSYFEFELQKHYDWIEIDCVVEGKFWFAQSNQNSQVFKATKFRDENVIEHIANKDVFLLCPNSPASNTTQALSVLQQECAKVGIRVHDDLQKTLSCKSFDMLYVDFNRVTLSSKNILALRKSAYEFFDAEAVAPIFLNTSHGIFEYGSKKTSSRFTHVLWSRSLGGVRRRVIEDTSVKCIYVRDIDQEDLHQIAELKSKPYCKNFILACSSIIIELKKEDIPSTFSSESTSVEEPSLL